MHALNRREVVRGLLLACAGCAAGGTGGGDTASNGACSARSAQGTGAYCLVEAVSLRARGGALLADGEAMLALLDDNTAVIVGRDAVGFFARSAVCTHACCVVMLCADAACSSLEPAPAACESTGPLRTDRVLCPCHGSEFRVSDGVPINGPATKPLPAYAVSIDGDDLLVDTGTTVDAAARLSA